MSVRRIEYDQIKPKLEPTALEVTVGVLRMLVAAVGLLVGGLVIVMAAVIPGRVKGARLASWFTVWLSRVFIRLFGVSVVCTDVVALQNHKGLVFINHLSHLDPVVITVVAPVRFLSTAGVKRLPVIGWIARSIGVIFVNRSSLRSRAHSRLEVVRHLQECATPPIVLAPEGQIGPGERVLPFRRGAFNIAVDADAGILPLILQYEPMARAVWIKGEWLPRAVWRLAARTSPFTAYLTVQKAIDPSRVGNIKQLVTETEQAFNEALARRPVDPPTSVPSLFRRGRRGSRPADT